MEDQIFIIGGGGSGSGGLLSTHIGKGSNGKGKGVLYLFNYDKQHKTPIIVDSNYDIDSIMEKIKNNINNIGDYDEL